MPDFEFDVDASIAAGWERFAARLAGFCATSSPARPSTSPSSQVPVPGSRTSGSPRARWRLPGRRSRRRLGHTRCHGGHRFDQAEISGGGREDDPRLAQGGSSSISSPVWDGRCRTRTSRTTTTHDRPRPRLSLPTYEATRLARLVAATIERVFGIPHPVFLHDVIDDGRPAGADGPAATERSPAVPEAAPVADDVDFRPIMITDPDQATRAVAAALSEIYHCRVEADEHDVFTVPAGCVVVFVRAHRSMPLIVFRSPLVPTVEDAGAAETSGDPQPGLTVVPVCLRRKVRLCRVEFADRVSVPVISRSTSPRSRRNWTTLPGPGPPRSSKQRDLH